MSKGKALVIRGGALGDFILTLPVLAALRRRFPDKSIEILGYPNIASLAVAAGLADRVTAIESPAFAGLFVRGGSWDAAVADYLAEFDMVVSYLYDPEGVFQRHATRAATMQFIAGPHRPDEASDLHATEFLLRPLEALGIHDADPRPYLELPAVTKPAEGFRLAMHPGSGSERKNWPETKWAEFLKLTSARINWNFLLIGGEAEGARCQRLSALIPAQRTNLAQNLPLVDLAQKMKACSAFIGHDSGITHLAAALDLPGLALWGPSSAATWRPRSDRMHLVQDVRGLAELPVETVIQEAEKIRQKQRIGILR
jgi:heptosyltransferase III